MELASTYIDRQVISFQDEVVEWGSNCLESKSFCTPPNSDSFDFDTLYDEVRYKADLFNKPYPDYD
jgi:hypothetical protein